MTTSQIGIAIIGLLCAVGALRFSIRNKDKPFFIIGMGFFATAIMTLVL